MRMKTNSMPLIGITMGDCNGISPEVIVKALSRLSLNEAAFVLIGATSVFESVNAELGTLLQYHLLDNWDAVREKGTGVYILDLYSDHTIEPHYGAIEKQAGEAAGRSLIRAAELAQQGTIDAVVTGSVSKKALALAGYHYPGQTEFLASLTHTEHVVMMLVAQNIRVGLATTHCALAEVAGQITVENLLCTIRIINRSLKEHFNIMQPKIAVCGLNPHSGDNGLFGGEEIDIIQPALKVALAEGICAEGPFPADTLFARKSQWDAYLAMYHDQGLIPFKINAFGKGVNYTAGLPIIRTSPDHGTAFDIAGKNCADEQSMMEAIALATKLVQNRTVRSTVQ